MLLSFIEIQEAIQCRTLGFEFPANSLLIHCAFDVDHQSVWGRFMKSILIKFVLICLVAVAWTGTTQALTCTLILPGAYIGGSQTLCVLACPAGDGEPLANAWLRGTTPVPYDATITATLFDGPYPIVNLPFEDIWLEFVDPNPPAANPPFSLCSCIPPLLADAHSDANGEVTFSGALTAGGCVENPEIHLFVGGDWCSMRNATNFQVVSVDVSCDLMVNWTSDQPVLTTLRMANQWCADLNHDTIVFTGGMKDARVLAEHAFFPPQPHTCP